ncbi:MAG: polysaccharide deacetylase family protein [Gemmatimonadales bacterium]
MIDVLLAGAGGAVLGALATGVYAPNSGLFGPAVGWGPPEQRRVYLTFDDGPNSRATDAILDTLAACGAPAAFFMVGDHVALFPGVARSVAAAGHLIGNHTQHHVKLHRRGPGRIRRELGEAHQTIADVTGVAPAAFRAPHGYRNPFVAMATRRLGYTVFGWSFGVWDSARPPAHEIRRRVRAKIAPGAIILLHDGDGYDPNGDRTPTADALAGIIEDARAAGYELSSLGALLR